MATPEKYNKKDLPSREKFYNLLNSSENEWRG